MVFPLFLGRFLINTGGGFFIAGETTLLFYPPFVFIVYVPDGIRGTGQRHG